MLPSDILGQIEPLRISRMDTISAKLIIVIFIKIIFIAMC